MKVIFMKMTRTTILAVVALLAMFALAGCNEKSDASSISDEKSSDDVIVGGDRDEHGCIGSAGYTWCEEKQKCLRTWEEDCPGLELAQEKEHEIADITEGIDSFGCNVSAGEVWCNDESRCVNLADKPCGLKHIPPEQVCTPEQKQNQACTMEYMPVCGVKLSGCEGNCSMTYGNKCAACAKGVDYWTDGEC